MKFSHWACVVVSLGMSLPIQAMASSPVHLIFKSSPGQLQPGSFFLPQGSQISSNLSVEPINFGLTAQQMKQIAELTHGQIDFSGYRLVRTSSEREALDLESRSDYLDRISQDVPPPMLLNSLPTPDPELKGQYWFDDLHVEKAWSIATGSGVTVADCDAGFYTTESDIHDNLLLALAHDFSDPDHPTKVDDGGFVFHGTAVVAIMAGVMDGKGTNGIAFNAKVVPFQNFNYDTTLDKLDKEEATAACILAAIKTPNVKVIVLENQTSTGSSETFKGTRDAVRLALQAGMTIVSAGGNYSTELLAEAQDDTQSIIVGALSQTGSQAGFSNFGKRIAVAAFGENLHTLYGPNGAFGDFGGTSGATPQVAGTVALMLEANSKLTPAQVRDLLIHTRVTTAANQTVGGQLDTFAAVDAAKNSQSDQPGFEASERFRARLNEILR